MQQTSLAKLEATDSKGANPQRYDRTLPGKPALALAVGKEHVAFAGPLDGDEGVALTVTDHRGNEAWSWTRSSGRLGGVGVDGDRRMLVALNLAGSGSASQGVVLRFGVFGHQSCSEALTCYGKTLASCDDGDACTADGCDGKTGCSHKAVTKRSCDVANGCSRRASCDANGSCVPSDEGRLFTLPTYLALSKVPPAFVRTTSGKERVCFMAEQSLWVDIRNYCVKTDDYEASPPLTLAESSGCGGSLPSVDDLEGYVDATVGGKVGCVRWGRKKFSVLGKTTYRAYFSRRGAATWNKSACGTYTCSATPLAMHPTAIGSTWAVMYEDYPSAGKIGPIRAVHYSPTTSTWGNVAHNRSNSSETYRAFAARKDGGVLIVTRRKSGSYYQAWVGSYASNGSTHYSRYISHSSRSLSANAVAPVEDGGAVVVGVAEPSGGLDSAWVARISGGGSLAWSKVASSPDGLHLTSVLPLATHIAVAGIKNLDAATKQSFIGGVRYDNGSFAFQRAFGSPTAIWTQLVGLSDGGLAVGTVAKPASSHVVTVVRTDAWGHQSCTAAGKCSAKTLADCDDGNTCVYNGCSAASGKCSADKVVSSGPCGTSGVCTQSGSCSE